MPEDAVTYLVGAVDDKLPFGEGCVPVKLPQAAGCKLHDCAHHGGGCWEDS